MSVAGGSRGMQPSGGLALVITGGCAMGVEDERRSCVTGVEYGTEKKRLKLSWREVERVAGGR